ncbi:hypothetical protein NL676_000958 [Syzygium grande]|nr:hypothetical protein NL676_000958 [Syzygium grande]
MTSFDLVPYWIDSEMSILDEDPACVGRAHGTFGTEFRHSQVQLISKGGAGANSSKTRSAHSHGCSSCEVPHPTERDTTSHHQARGEGPARASASLARGRRGSAPPA